MSFLIWTIVINCSSMERLQLVQIAEARLLTCFFIVTLKQQIESRTCVKCGKASLGEDRRASGAAEHHKHTREAAGDCGIAVRHLASSGAHLCLEDPEIEETSAKPPSESNTSMITLLICIRPERITLDEENGLLITCRTCFSYMYKYLNIHKSKYIFLGSKITLDNTISLFNTVKLLWHNLHCTKCSNSDLIFSLVFL